MNCKRIIFLLVVIFGVAACSGPRILHLKPLEHNSTSTPVITVQPKHYPKSLPSALMYAFEINQDIDCPERVSKEVGGIFYRVWLGRNVFSRLEYREDATWPGMDNSLYRGVQEEVDVIIRPSVNYFLSGGSQGNTSIALHVDVYSVPEGKLLWSMGHAGRMENRPDQDYGIFIQKTKMPSSPEYVITKKLASEMAYPLKMWGNGLDWREKQEQR